MNDKTITFFGNSETDTQYELEERKNWKPNRARLFVPDNWSNSNQSDSAQPTPLFNERILLKNLLMYFSKKTWVSIVYKCSSNGAYRVAELLEKDEPILYKYASTNCIELYLELASAVLAEDSQERMEFFNYAADREIPYLIIEVQD